MALAHKYKSTSFTPPCSVIEEHVSLEGQKCCQLLNTVFHRRNTDKIMTLLKYSLDMSNPWITQYYKGEKEDKQTLGDNRDMYKLWLTNRDNELINLFSKNGRDNFPQEYG